MSDVEITIDDKTTGQKGMYSLDGTNWKSIPTDPIPVTNQIWIKLNDAGFFDICFNMGSSSANVAFTAEFMDTHIWKLSDFTGDKLHVTIKDDLNTGA